MRLTPYEKAVTLWQQKRITNDAELAEALNSNSIAFAYHSGKIENENISYQIFHIMILFYKALLNEQWISKIKLTNVVIEVIKKEAFRYCHNIKSDIYIFFITK